MPLTPNYPDWLKAFAILASLVIVLGLLNWAQAVLIPIALAILLTFLLSPIVTQLERWHLGRAPSAILVVILAFSLLGGIGWLVARQITSLVDTFPQYRQNITQKIADWNENDEDGFVEKAERIAADIVKEIKRMRPDSASNAAVKKPLPVEIVEQDTPFNPSALWSVLAPILEPFASVGLAVVLVIFMLIKREDLRDRVISMVGHGRLTHTTKALEEAGERVSRYLLFQLTINGSYGIVIGTGLFFIGVPFAFLWGFFAAIFRYIPYLGPWLAALLPIGVSLVVSDNWTMPLLVVSLFLTLELISNMLLEPWLYGKGIGVSETATLIMIAFWTWLWGPIGLILATPLTVCLVVLGKYVPFLGIFGTLLGNKPVLEPHIGFYQRLLARDIDEAADIAEDYRESNSLEQTYDNLLIPTLIYTKRDVENGSLSEADQDYILKSTRSLGEQLAAVPAVDIIAPPTFSPEDNNSAGLLKVRILGCPASDAADQDALLMLKEILDPERCELILITTASMTSEVVSLVEKVQPALVCIAALPPGGIRHTRLLCLRLRARFPDLKIIVGRWGVTEDSEKYEERLRSAGADDFAISLEETRTQVVTWVQFLARRESEPVMGS